jgi:hypothetical protein
MPRRQRPVGFHETKHAVDRDVVVEQCAHDFDLLEHALDEFGAVAISDEQAFYPRPHESAFDLEVGAASVLLGVDDVDAAGSHRHVVDVGPSSGDPPVMQQPECPGGELVEPPTESLLAKRSDIPRPGGLLLVGDREDEASELRVLGADALLAPGLAALELSTR